ncbi:MAG: tRNA 2-selenouridine(34) synthase MnmH [Proteobacteria bacterium]|nr:tRNA 2-selenouridine(34) synthase MnmH [Pseudomonadota bacterium]
MTLQRLLKDSRFIDLRAPLEFARGSVPNATNLPLLDDSQRAAVGLMYKNSGQAAAIALGEQLVSGPCRETRMQGWAQALRDDPDLQFFCWRGGLRSQIVVDWLSDLGLNANRVEGGYKALRQTCLDTLQSAALSPLPWRILGGRTGSGKTSLLTLLTNSIDLEGLAHHRGSAFGATSTPQPTLIDFENQLALNWLNHTAHSLVLEDESRTIGRLAIPETWHVRMGRAPLVLLEVSLDERIQNIVDEYVHQPLARGVDAGHLLESLKDSLSRIQKRLGGVRHGQLVQMLEQAFVSQDHSGWVGGLLTGYYDPMYDYQLEKKDGRVCFRGGFKDITEYLTDEAAWD